MHATRLFDHENPYDIVFVGHLCYDEIQPYTGESWVAPGSAVLCGAIAAARVGKRTAAIVRMSTGDIDLLSPLKDAGVDIYLIPSKETTFVKVIHTSTDVDMREIIQVRNAGAFDIHDMPAFSAHWVHLAGISDQEFNLDFVQQIKCKHLKVCSDMQSFIRQVDSESHRIHFKDVAFKKELIPMLDCIKMDMVEANILTGAEDIATAAVIMEEWGSIETVITHSEGVLARSSGKTYYARFSNQSNIGRTGRGDTTFSAYLSWRLEHSIEDSLEFAAALVSIKMESRGPFSGKIEDVLRRMRRE